MVVSANAVLENSRLVTIENVAVVNIINRTSNSLLSGQKATKSHF